MIPETMVGDICRMPARQDATVYVRSSRVIFNPNVVRLLGLKAGERVRFVWDMNDNSLKRRLFVCKSPESGYVLRRLDKSSLCVNSTKLAGSIADCLNGPGAYRVSKSPSLLDRLTGQKCFEIFPF